MAKRVEELIEKITKLKKEKKAIVLAHNYQRGEVQDLADYVGDSVELARKAKEEEEAEIIVHCSVDFMAETAVLLNPGKKVLMPSKGARCPMAAMLPAYEVKRWRRREPNTPVVLYVNTLAEAKAYADVCCTSANAVKIVNALESDTILFGPDANLAWYVSQKTGKTVIPVPKRGFCQTHILFSKEDIATAREENPNAVVMVHPECLPEVQRVADFIGSTSQMCRYANNSSAKRLVVATEVGLLHRLKKENPGKEFVPAYEGAMCVNMKLNTLTNIYLALKEERNRMVVPKSVAKRAKISLENMFEIISR